MLDGITNNSKIYIFCPANLITGGAELLHQLADFLSKLNKTAFIVYFKNTEIITCDIPEAYKKYNIKTVSDIEYSKENVYIFPETAVFFLRDFNTGIRMIWWLSVDNYYLAKNSTIIEYYNFIYRNIFKSILFVTKSIIGDILKHREHPNFKNCKLKKIDKTIIHLYQSEYAKDFLSKKGISKLYPLKDYINDDYFENNIKKIKKDTILYNPKKGFSFTKKLIAAAPELSWLPIQNMSRQQVKEAMLESKLYIDFGNHPGMDRIPREAALCGCCIITGKNGSARYHTDVPIPVSYKFSQSNNNIKKIVRMIHATLDNFDKVSHDFDLYRNIISNQKADFAEEVKYIFN